MFGFNFNFNGMNFGFGNQRGTDPRMMMVMSQLQPLAQQIASVLNIIYENPEQANKQSLERYNKRILMLLVESLHQAYPEITDHAYKLRYEYCECEDSNFKHIYPNEMISNFLEILGVRAETILFRIKEQKWTLRMKAFG